MSSRTLTTIRRRSSIDDGTIQARIIAESDQLVLLTPCVNFLFDGFTIIRKPDIVSREIKDSDRYHVRLMREERRWPPLPKYLRGINLTDWQTALRTIRASVVIVEDERGEGDFLIGPIVGIDRRKVTLHFFDACGRWKNEEAMPLSRITTCRFLDRYSATHADHLVWGDEQKAGTRRATGRLKPAVRAG